MDGDYEHATIAVNIVNKNKKRLDSDDNKKRLLVLGFLFSCFFLPWCCCSSLISLLSGMVCFVVINVEAHPAARC